MMRIIMSGSVVMGALASMAVAEVDGVADALSTKGVRHVTVLPHVREHTHIVTRDVTYPAATVDRAMSDQPVRPHMIELKVAQTTTWIDPDVSYTLPTHHHLDQGHSIVRAQRLFKSRNRDLTQRAHVIYGGPEKMAARTDDVKPAFILMRPDYLERKDKEQNRGMPEVPGAVPKETEKQDKKLMARADDAE